MRLTIDLDPRDDSILKRGDILQTNVGDKRERTCLILHARRIKTCRRNPERLPEFPKGTPISTIRSVIEDRVHAREKLPPRFVVWCERWWELEPDFRMRLYRSAERNGGQQVICFHRYPPKKKKRFDPFLHPF